MTVKAMPISPKLFDKLDALARFRMLRKIQPLRLIFEGMPIEVAESMAARPFGVLRSFLYVTTIGPKKERDNDKI